MGEHAGLLVQCSCHGLTGSGGGREGGGYLQEGVGVVWVHVSKRLVLKQQCQRLWWRHERGGEGHAHKVLARE